jgi:hypothetical protein
LVYLNIALGSVKANLRLLLLLEDRNLLLSSRSTSHGSANIVLKTDLMLCLFDGNVIDWQ